MPLTPRFDMMERNRKRRELAGLRNAAANQGPPTSNKTFSSPTRNGIFNKVESFGKQMGTEFAVGLTKPIYKLADVSTREWNDKVPLPDMSDEGVFGKERFLRGNAAAFTLGGRLAPEDEFINRIKEDTRDYGGRELGSDLLASYANFVGGGGGMGGRLVNASKGYIGETAVGALRGMEAMLPRTKLAAELAGGGMTTRIPRGLAPKGAGYKPYGAAAGVGTNISKFEDALPEEDVIFRPPGWLEEAPSIPSQRGTIDEAKQLVDSPSISPENPRSPRTKGSVPVTIDNVEDANSLFFGPNVSDTGSVGSSLLPDFHEGSSVMIGRRLSPERVAKDMLTVARRGIRERFGNIKTTGTERPIWAETTLGNFERDFGEGTARVTNMEGRRSITGPYDDASTIPQTIQYDHTIVSPTDLRRFSDETTQLYKEGKLSRADRARRKQVEKDMRVILQDTHNLIPVHRNTNVLLSSFDRERLLSDPEFAASVDISDQTLGDIWGIMSADGSGYRASVEKAYDWARRGRNGKRAESVDYWQQWQNDNVANTVSRRNKRMVEAGIKLS